MSGGMSRQSHVCPRIVRPSDSREMSRRCLSLMKNEIVQVRRADNNRNLCGSLSRGVAPGMSIQEASTINNVLIAKSSRISLSFQGGGTLKYCAKRNPEDMNAFGSLKYFLELDFRAERADFKRL
ncbi:unnamed protein product [Pleuronectes platessa]|uniref:Uncharacterized protein n=1 Tax=Pleuronectes platessa TaxID=8262 RepID=A0A9N7VJ02_PLEPL|nr:unnamed protein product [Pleuronectes platessa]